MSAKTVIEDPLEARDHPFYCQALILLSDSGMPFLVGGAYAFARYTGIVRHTKDLDVFVRPEDCERVLDVFAAAGYHTELTFPHWLGKAFRGEDFVDVIFSSGNGVAGVDGSWFEHSVEDRVLGIPVKLCPAEEMIWQKAYVMERERFDGADVAHLLRARAAELDWPRLLGRFGSHWRVLLSHLILFGFIYPAERAKIPDPVMQELLGRVQHELTSAPREDRICQGTLLSREQYLIDTDSWHYKDARLRPTGQMTRKVIDRWTAAIDKK
jgi:hypothetical protein